MEIKMKTQPVNTEKYCYNSITAKKKPFDCHCTKKTDVE